MNNVESDGDINITGSIDRQVIEKQYNLNLDRDSKGSINKPFQAPPLSEYFVDRPEVTKNLKKRLLTNNCERKGTLVISAIQGLGGIGKTSLTQALAHDREIQERFSDGILWATLGNTPDLLPLLQNWIMALNDYSYKPTTVQAASIHLKSLLHDKAVLLVVDDAWNIEDLEPFRVGSDRCQVIITTRLVNIADRVGAELYSLDFLTEEESLELFTKRLRRKLEDREIKEAKVLAKTWQGDNHPDR